MATQATVQLVVDESGAIPGLTRFQQRAMAAMKGTHAETTSLNEAITKLTAAIDTMGAGSAKAGAQMDASLQRTSGHLRTNLDGVRLMSQEFGLRMPRALESMASRVPAITKAISGMMGAFTAVAVGEILVNIIGKLDEMEHSLMGDSKAMQELHKALVEANNQEIISPKNTDQAMRNLQLLRDGVKAINDEIANNSPNSAKNIGIDSLLGPLAIINDYRSISAQNEAKDKLLGNETLQQKTLDANTALNKKMSDEDLRQQRENALIGLQGYRKIAQETANAKAEIDEQVANRTLTADQGKSAKGLVDQKAAREYLQLSTEINKKIIQMQNEAINAGLEGDARLRAEREQSIAAVTAAFRDSELTKRQMEEETAALSLKYDNEKIERTRKMMEDAYKALRDAQSQGLTGLAKIHAENDARNADIDRMDITPGAKDIRHQASNLQANQEEGAYWQENDEKEGEQMQRDAEQRARNAADDLDYDRRAAAAERRVKQDGLDGWVSDYKGAIAEIEAQRQEMMARLDDEREKNQLTDQEYSQRKVDIERTADAQIAEENRQMARTLSQTLEEAFTNPVEFIKSRMQKMFFEIVAEWIERSKMFQGVFGQTMGSAGPQGASGGFAGGLGGLVRGTFGGHPSIAGGGGGYGPSGSAGAGSGSVGGIYDGGYSPSSSTGGGYRPEYTGGGGVGSTVSSTIGSARSLYGTLSTARNTVGSPLYNGGGDIGAQGGIGTAGSFDLPMSGTDDSMGHEAGHASDVGASSGSNALNAAFGIAGAGMAAYSAVGDTKSAFKSGSAGGILKGTMNDAMAGAEIGMLAGPVGALIGAGIGAAVGAISGVTGMIMGEGGKLAARDYYKQSIFPAIERLRNDNGGGDWQSAISQINTTARDGDMYMSHKWGGGAAEWVDANYLRKEQMLAVGQIEARARGGSYAVSMSAGQYHDGGGITGFGDLATSSTEGFIHAMLGEAVVNPTAASTHAPAIRAMNAGASPEDVAQMYGANAGSNGGGDTHYHTWNVNTLDPKSFKSYLRGGGIRSIVQEMNHNITRYAGDGISG